MDEFLRENYSLLIHSCEFIAAATGLILYKKYKSSTAVYFIYFLIYSMLLDMLGHYVELFDFYGYKELIDSTILENNYLFFTIFWDILAPTFYAFYFIKIIELNVLRRFLRYCIFVFLFLSTFLIYYYFNILFVGYIPLIQITSTLLVIIIVITYFYDILKSDRILIFYKSINFFIAATILVWWLIMTPIMFYEIYFSKADWNFMILKWQIYLITNLIMYGTFTFALIWCKPQKN